MPRWSDIVDLLIVEETTNDNGFDNENVIREQTTVFVNKKDVRSSEFYLAAQSGFSLEMMFEVRSADYSGQELLKYNDLVYEIVRTYNKGELTELVCQSFTKGEVV